ncbi:MAG: CPBP family intramembrane metalloprotease [Actinobacteria bacterium]|nr:CPBP family intramembrane metalloprotease [Actinomycetota bacterium]
MDRCAQCEATLYGDAEWCSQCFAPLRAPAANPFAARVAQPAHQPVAATVAAPAAPPPSPAPPPWATAPDPFASGPPIARYDARSGDQNDVVAANVASAKADEGRVAKPLALILLLGFLVQVALGAYSATSNSPVADQIRTGQWVILAFYAVVFAVVVRMAREVDFLPLWSRGPTAENIAIGAFKGVLVATAVLLLVSLAVGHVQVAPSVKWELGDATLFSVVLALLGLVVAAPVVEELLFRGFVGEALRHRGDRIALLASAVLFALWHMRFGVVQIVYYTVLGVMLGRTYLKRGLVASVAAHAGFNGTLAVVALVFILGPGSTLSANGVSVHAPGGWDEIDVAAVEGDAVFAAHGPSQAVFYVVGAEIPTAVTAEQMLSVFMGGGPGATFGEVAVGPAGVRQAQYSAGAAIRVGGKQGGERVEAAVFFRGTTVWEVVLQNATDRTEDDFEEMLETLRLP